MPGGRPTARFALAKLARCGRCMAPMQAKTSTYVRKDRSQQRFYVCANKQDGNGVCDQPRIDAETVDRAVIAHLDGFFIDFDAWLDEVTEARSADHEHARGQLATAEGQLATLTRREQKVREVWTQAIESGDERREQIAYETLEPITQKRQVAEEATASRRAAVEGYNLTPPVDALLDTYNRLAAAVRGQLEEGENEGLAAVNERLRATLAHVWLNTVTGPRLVEK